MAATGAVDVQLCSTNTGPGYPGNRMVVLGGAVSKPTRSWILLPACLNLVKAGQVVFHTQAPVRKRPGLVQATQYRVDGQPAALPS
jgi:hypothetical protein